jgi:hypothetical protein
MSLRDVRANESRMSETERLAILHPFTGPLGMQEAVITAIIECSRRNLRGLSETNGKAPLPLRCGTVVGALAGMSLRDVPAEPRTKSKFLAFIHSFKFLAFTNGLSDDAWRAAKRLINQ